MVWAAAGVGANWTPVLGFNSDNNLSVNLIIIRHRLFHDGSRSFSFTKCWYSFFLFTRTRFVYMSMFQTYSIACILCKRVSFKQFAWYEPQNILSRHRQWRQSGLKHVATMNEFCLGELAKILIRLNEEFFKLNPRYRSGRAIFLYTMKRVVCNKLLLFFRLVLTNSKLAILHVCLCLENYKII